MVRIAAQLLAALSLLGLALEPTAQAQDAPRAPSAPADVQVAQGWSGEPLPKGMRKGKEKPVVIHDTGKGLEIEMVYVPPGDFVMGSDRASEHEPRHKHAMPKGYYIGRCETTWREYRAFSKASGRALPDVPGGATDDHPVVNVAWDDAKAFCEWAGLTLPTEAQWEKAARGADGLEYPFGADWDGGVCNHGESGRPDKSDGWEQTAPVGTYPDGKSPYGALDMSGNVWEWCDDWDEWEAYVRYAKGDMAPPKGGDSRMYRGGCFRTGPEYCGGAYRASWIPSDRLRDVGFRPARVTTE